MMFVRLRFSMLALFCVLALSGCGMFSTTTLGTSHPVPATHTPHSAPTPTPQATAVQNPAYPTRLLIPAIGVNSAVEKVTILANGDLATPTIHPWDDTGWYDLGTSPGERGSAVIDGHLDRPGGAAAVFWYLRNLHAGDAVMVTNSQGKMLHFRVTQVAAYPPQQAPLQNIFGNNSGKYLNLITCAGDWIPSQHQTTLRLVVYTTFVS